MCLGHGGDFAHLGDAAAADDVGHDVVCELLVEDGSEVPAGDEPFADADGHRDLVFDEFEGVMVFGQNVSSPKHLRGLNPDARVS